MSSFKKIKNHSVTRNAAALGIMQIANYAVPLLLLPFLTRQLGLEAFGIVAITLAAIQFAFVLTDYGFTLSATYAISVNRDNINYINKKIGAVFGAKALLLSAAAIALLAIPHAVQKLSIYAPYFAAALIATAAQAFQPIWLFQGVERMKNITIYTVATKVLYALLVLILVRAPDDAILVIFCWSAAQFIGLIASIYFMYAEGYRITTPSFTSIKEEFKQGAQFFWSRLAVSLYTSASTLIVGTHSTVQAAHFSVCEQIYKAGQNITSPINNAMFPYMAKNKDWNAFYKVLMITGLVMILGCLTLSFFAEFVLGLLFGAEYKVATPVLLVFMCTTVVNYFAVTFGYSAFSALGRIGIANISVIAGGVLHATILSLQYLFYEISAYNVAFAVLATEIFVMTVRIGIFFYLKNCAESISTDDRCLSE